jgi:hypothetical protein
MKANRVRAVIAAVSIVASGVVTGGVSIGAAFASSVATLHLSAPKSEIGHAVVIKGTAEPRSALRYDGTAATVVLYEVGKTSLAQLGEAKTVSANGAFTLTEPAAPGTRTYSVQFIPVGGLSPVSATIRISLRP